MAREPVWSLGIARDVGAHGPATSGRRLHGDRCRATVEVALVPWPDEESVLDDLARADRPRILMVASTAPPPDVRDPLEDWVRVPVDHGDVEVRARRLARIALARRSPDNGVGSDAPDVGPRDGAGAVDDRLAGVSR